MLYNSIFNALKVFWVDDKGQVIEWRDFKSKLSFFLKNMYLSLRIILINALIGKQMKWTAYSFKADFRWSHFFKYLIFSLKCKLTVNVLSTSWVQVVLIFYFSKLLINILITLVIPKLKINLMHSNESTHDTHFFLECSFFI